VVIGHRAMGMGVTTSHDTHPRRNADGILAIGAGEDRSGSRKPIQDRGQSVVVALMSHGSEIVLIGHKEQNVRRTVADTHSLAGAATR